MGFFLREAPERHDPGKQCLPVADHWSLLSFEDIRGAGDGGCAAERKKVEKEHTICFIVRDRLQIRKKLFSIPVDKEMESGGIARCRGNLKMI